MAVKDDLIASGLSEAQAVAVAAADAGTGGSDELVRAGFSQVQATEIMNKEATTGSDAALAASGLWAGTQVPAIDAGLAVVD